jgi:hypothetical protein
MKYTTLDADARVGSRAEIDALIDSLAGMPEFVRGCVNAFDPDALRRRSDASPDAFSLHEHVWHLRDIEVLGYSRRLRALLEEENPFMADIDGARLAAERGYLELPLATGLREFFSARAENVAMLLSLPVAAFQRRGELETVGCSTLFGLIGLWCNHDEGHRGEMRELPSR